MQKCNAMAYSIAMKGTNCSVLLFLLFGIFVFMEFKSYYFKCFSSLKIN